MGALIAPKPYKNVDLHTYSKVIMYLVRNKDKEELTSLLDKMEEDMPTLNISTEKMTTCLELYLHDGENLAMNIYNKEVPLDDEHISCIRSLNFMMKLCTKAVLSVHDYDKYDLVNQVVSLSESFDFIEEGVSLEDWITYPIVNNIITRRIESIQATT